MGRIGISERVAVSLLLFLAFVYVGGAGLTGCTPETRYRILSTVFDGVPAPGEERPPRRRRAPAVPVPRAAAPAPVPRPVLVPPGGPSFDTFAELKAAFPSDAMGNVDWVAAVRGGLLRPLPGVGPQAADIPPLPLDVRLDPGIPQMEVVFPHEAHTYWLRCDSCHPGIFEMRAGADRISMASIFAGEHCGRCHGKVAFRPETGCPRCHPRLRGSGP